MTRTVRVWWLTIVAIAIIITGTRLFPSPSHESTITDALVGESELEIIAKLGEPIQDRPGYITLGLYSRQNPPGDIRTLIYYDRAGGTCWVWLGLQSGRWTCIESCWFADGVEF